MDRRARALVVAVVLIGYLVVARGAGDLYPFSTFAMYAGGGASSASRIVARDAGGALRELDAYRALSCDALPDAGACAEGGVYTIDYLDRDAVAYLRAHRGEVTGGVPVDVVRHIWRFGGAEEDCLLARCRGAPR